jgi:hypothetical protein
MRLLAMAGLLLLGACGSTPPAWKTDTAVLIERYKSYALRGENTLAERAFEQAVAATGSTGQIAGTAHLWLVRCAIRRAMLIDDACAEYAELARYASDPADRAYYRFLTLQWETLDTALLPAHHRALLAAGDRSARLAALDDPLARLLDASLLVMRGEAHDDTLTLATDTASAQGWRQPLLTYLLLREARARAAGDEATRAVLRRRIDLVDPHPPRSE